MDTACILWTGPVDREGYGRMSGGRLAHRIAYETEVGPIPSGLTIDHLCRVRNCINVEHMEPVTIRENVRRGSRATRTHCEHGHPFDESNTYYRKDRPGNRCCRRCNALAQERRRCNP